MAALRQGKTEMEAATKGDMRGLGAQILTSPLHSDPILSNCTSVLTFEIVRTRRPRALTFDNVGLFCVYARSLLTRVLDDLGR